MEETKNEEKSTTTVENSKSKEETKKSTDEVKKDESTDSKKDSVEKETTNKATTNEKQAEKSKTNKKEEKPDESKAEKKPKKKMGNFKKSLIFILIVVILSAIGSAIYFLKFATKTIDISSYIVLEYEGYDGNATATASLDTDGIAELLNDESLAKKFVKKATLELSKSEKLSNGDEIEVEIEIKESWLEDNKLKLKEDKVKITVSGIDEANSIDLSKYLEIEYEGLNKAATASVSIDTTALGKFLGNTTLAETFARKATLKIEDNEELTNGDKLTINVTIDEDWLNENGLELASNKIKITIEGLEEGTEIDVFKDISVSVSGMSPNIKLSVTTNSTDEFIKTVKYTLSKSTGISNGETITITAASWDKDMANEKGYVVSPTTYEYTVENQAGYVSSTSEITSSVKSQIESSFIEKAKSKALETASSPWGGVYYHNIVRNLIKDSDYQYVTVTDEDYDKDITLTNAEVVSLYLLTQKSDSSADSINQLIGIVRLTCHSTASGVDYVWYATVTAKNFSLKSDGTISDNAVYSTSLDNGKSEETAYENYINNQKDDYNVEKVN